MPAPARTDAGALAFLQSAGATRISLLQRGSHTVLHVGIRGADEADVGWWLPATQATAVGRAARQLAGPDADVTRLSEAIHEAARRRRVALTPHDVAMARAAQHATAVDRALEILRRSGELRRFNREYQQRREWAQARQERFVGYGVAFSRLRKAVMAIMASGGEPTRLDFAELFRRESPLP
jgi:hypothetical protein